MTNSLALLRLGLGKLKRLLPIALQMVRRKFPQVVDRLVCYQLAVVEWVLLVG
jgi:hypothetical protein